MRILIVEDEKKVAAFIKKGLEEETYAVDVAHDGEEGLFLASESQFDLIILDLMLPKINGLDVLTRLREQKVGTAILLLTAKDSVEDKVTGLNKGADDYLTKPFAFSELLARVRSLLRRGAGDTKTLLKGRNATRQTGLNQQVFQTQRLFVFLVVVAHDSHEVTQDRILFAPLRPQRVW